MWICDVICLFQSRARVTYSADPCPSQCSSVGSEYSTMIPVLFIVLFIIYYFLFTYFLEHNIFMQVIILSCRSVFKPLKFRIFLKKFWFLASETNLLAVLRGLASLLHKTCVFLKAVYYMHSINCLSNLPIYCNTATKAINRLIFTGVRSH